MDGLHRLAGSRNLIELHGNIQRNKCSAEGRVVENLVETGEVPPRCPECGALLRPDVVWFGKSLPTAAIQAALVAARSSQVFFSIGTSGLVEPAATLPLIAMESGAVVVEVNPEQTPLTGYFTYVLQGLSGIVLPALAQLPREK